MELVDSGATARAADLIWRSVLMDLQATLPVSAFAWLRNTHLAGIDESGVATVLVADRAAVDQVSRKFRSDIERRLMGIDATAGVTIYRSKGCSHCNQVGYRGRMSIMEIVRFDRELDEALAGNKSLGELRAIAVASGFRPLADDGIRRVVSGDTSLDEIARVIDLTERALGATR